MPGFDLTGLNWLAVAVAALGSFLVGALWYTVLFGKAWIRLMGFSDADMARAAKLQPLMMPMFLACYFVLATVTAVLVKNLRLTTPAEGATLGALLFLGPAAAVGLTNHVPSLKPLGAFAINAGYMLVYCVGMGVTLATWR